VHELDYITNFTFTFTRLVIIYIHALFTFSQLSLTTKYIKYHNITIKSLPHQKR